MHNFITTYENWLEEYRKDKYKIWIRATLSNNLEIYLPDYYDWMKLKTYCTNNKLAISKVGLQYRSHSIEVDTQGADGVYLVRSILGTLGSTTKETYTIGKLYGNIVKKTIWIIPELIKELDDEDHIDKCFEEAIIYNVQNK